VLDDLAQIPAVGHGNEWGVMVGALTAAQVGLPERAPHLDLDELAGQGEPGQIGFTDFHVAFGLMRLQQGDASTALTALEAAASGTPAFNANANAAYALALAADGRHGDAVERATAVLECETGTYADTVAALQTRGLALAQSGDSTGSAAAFDEAHTIVDATDDVLLQALLKLSEASALQVLGDDRAATVLAVADADLDALGLSDTGWRVAYSTAANGAFSRQ
jgi:tetratricopeptide (TPR) repeat protein